MTKLDARGIISIVVIVIYIPVLLAGVILSMRHGFARKAGWIYLVILSIIRLIGSVTHILAEQNPTNTNYTTIYTIMEAAGTSPLLVATLGFLMTVAQYGLDQKPQLQQGHKLVSLVALIALILAIVGGTSISSAKTENDLNNANTLRHVSSALFAVVYAAVVFLTFYCWQHKKMIRTYRRKLLMGISITLPFLGIRVLEGILSAFAPLQFAVQDGHVVLAPGNTNALSKFSSQSSAWGIYLFMLVLPEYISVVIYAVVGIVTPLKKDAEEYEVDAARGSQGSSRQGLYPLPPAYPVQTYTYPPQQPPPAPASAYAPEHPVDYTGYSRSGDWK